MKKNSSLLTYRFVGKASLFLGMSIAMSVLVFPALKKIFLANIYFNSVIALIFFGGIFFLFLQFFFLIKEEGYLNRLLEQNNKVVLLSIPQVFFLDPVIKIYEKSTYVAPSLISEALQTCKERLVEKRTLTRYLANLLIFLGLLGTFWGLSQTISQITEVLSHLPSQGSEENFFDLLKFQLQKPLSGMSIAFSSSLFGLGGSLILGLMDFQLAAAHQEFFRKTERWTHQAIKTSSQMHPTEFAWSDTSVKAYIPQLLEGIDKLGKLYAVQGQHQKEFHIVLVKLLEKVGRLSDLMKEEQMVLNRFADEQLNTHQILQKIDNQWTNALSEGRSLKEHLGAINVVSHEILKALRNDNKELGEIFQKEFRFLGKLLTQTQTK